MSMLTAHVSAFIGGVLLVLLPLRSAVRTYVLPRGVNDSLTRMVVQRIMRLFLLVASPRRAFELRGRDQAWRDFVGWWVNYDAILP